MISYQTYTDTSNIPKNIINDIQALASHVFCGAKDVFEYMSLFQMPLILVAYNQNTIAGFKLGFQYNQKIYYSWLGCIEENYRKQGIAGHLMQMQHEWCKKAGYDIIETRTENRYKEMLVLNIKHGFDISGTLMDKGDFKILLRKNLKTTV